MGVRQNDNNRLFLAILLGIFMASGCSGHSVKYGANSEGEGMASEEGMAGSVDDITYDSDGIARYADGTPVHGGTVDGSDPYLQSGKGKSENRGEMAGIVGTSSMPGSGSDYGQQFGGVDGSGPNHGDVTGFGSGSANASNPDPETWANAYLRKKRGSEESYGEPSSSGSAADGSSYGQEYSGVPGSGPNHGAVDGFSQGSAAETELTPEMWAEAYLNENGGKAPEYINSDMKIAQANGPNSGSMGLRDSNGKLLRSGFEGRVQDIYFAFDSWSISAEGARYLKEDAQWLQANPDKGLTIEGHCDQRGTQDYNLVLGKKRAQAARDYLVNLGIQPHRIQIVSYGKERPFCQKNDEYCHQENRRNHMVVRMNQS